MDHTNKLLFLFFLVLRKLVLLPPASKYVSEGQRQTKRKTIFVCMILSMASTESHKKQWFVLFFWSLIFRNIQKTYVFLFFCFLRNSCPSRLLPKSLPETRKTRKNIVFCMFLSMTSSESYKNNGFLHMRHAGPPLIGGGRPFSTHATR